ncbi:MAG: DUF1553 domain-containing protein [Acidobacteria bacterium]|nr:DUF1553 domain-containing protein [Acidobacteriota bacterium]
MRTLVSRLSRRPTIPLLAAAFLLIPALQSTGGAEPSSSAPLSLRLMPETTTLRWKDASQQFSVVATLAGGRKKDVTARAEFSLADPAVARLGSAGRVLAAGDGETWLKVTFGSLKARAAVVVVDSARPPPFSYEREIGAILTRRGCNDIACHAGVKGQGGFRLSINAAHPSQDYDWIVTGGVYQVLTDKRGEPIVPRVDTEAPERSLLLRKPSLELAHGGGLRLETGSEDYRAILDWIGRGAPYREGNGAGLPTVEGLEVFPREGLLQKGGSRQLIVTALLSDGTREDFTHRVRFESKQQQVADLDGQGLVRALNPGESNILVRGAGYEVQSRIGVVAEWIPDYPELPRANFIDDEVFAKLRKFNILPSPLSGDAEFLRRVCLDLTGRIPPAERVREFLTDPDPRKREKLIEVLLDSPEFVDYWTFRLADLFRVAVFPVGINPKWSQSYWEWIRDAVARNRPYDRVAEERIAAQGYSPASRHYLPYLVLPPPENMMGEEVRVFMGRRLDCAQCHDHPYERWTQDQFWGMAAFFGSMFRLGANPESVVFDSPDGREVAADVPSPTELRVLHPRTGQEVVPTLLNGTRVSYDGPGFPRGEMAKWITSHPYFAEASVNRFWSYFFGRGIVDPVDDFRSNNPPTHPELLRRLAEDFARNGYDLRHLFRRIVHSRTYQLSSTVNHTNRADRLNYSRALSRPLDAEILLDAICDVTGVPETFGNWLHRKKGRGGPPRGTRAVQLKETDIYQSTFLDTFGRPNRFSIPERDGKSNLTQALHLLVGSTYNDKLWNEGARVYELFQRGASDVEIVEELYLAAYSRFPEPEEVEEVQRLITRTPSRQQALRDLQWALITSREFAENH